MRILSSVCNNHYINIFYPFKYSNSLLQNSKLPQPVINSYCFNYKKKNTLWKAFVDNDTVNTILCK